MSVAVDRYILVIKSLNDEIRHDTTVIDGHIRPIGIKDADNFSFQLPLPMVVHEKRFGCPLALVIATAETDRIHISPIRFRLRMDERIAIHFTGRSLQNTGTLFFRQVQHIDSPQDRGLDRLNRIMLIVDRRSRTC